TFLGEFDGSEYYLSDYEESWTNANEWLQSLGEPEIHLVTIGSQEENDFVRGATNEMIGDIDVWIGFTDMYDEGNWEWAIGEEVVYTNWAQYEPNNGNNEEHWAHLWPDGKWNDAENYPLHFIVEVEETSESATILDVHDVPDDQGGRVYIKFARSSHDTDPLRTPEMYTVERLDGDTWVGLNSVSAYGNDEYVVEATTLADSTSENDAIMTYRIIAAMEEGNFASEPESGYSVDNIAPGAPTGVVAGISDGVVYLEWAPSDANDLDYYAVYRSTDPEFLPGEDNMIGSSEGSDFADDVEELGDYYYAVTAFDIHENESDPSELVNVTLLSLEDIHGLPEVFTLHQNYPNPFNPNTQIQYALPTDANVSIVIYDLMGRQIRTLVNQQISAGYHSVMWNATSDMGSPVSAGVYIYTITANDFRDVKKMVLLK
ncbi:MAG: lectin-like protein, partial [Candidatus Neomarinimicrobiota bacterium]|nr:lectin-like protein [Candidatus Neomarinimicrobiota bacterium]